MTQKPVEAIQPSRLSETTAMFLRYVRTVEKRVHPVNGEVPPVKGRPWKLPHYVNRGKTTSSGGEMASARSCFSTVRTALGKLRITGLPAPFDVARSFPQFLRPLPLQPTVLTSKRRSRFGIRKAPNHVPPPHLPDDPKRGHHHAATTGVLVTERPSQHSVSGWLSGSTRCRYLRCLYKRRVRPASLGDEPSPPAPRYHPTQHLPSRAGDCCQSRRHRLVNLFQHRSQLVLAKYLNRLKTATLLVERCQL